jgi:hypothetical protein
MRCEWLQALGKCGDTAFPRVGDALTSASVEPASLLVAAVGGVVAGYTATRTSAGGERE